MSFPRNKNEMEKSFTEVFNTDDQFGRHAQVKSFLVSGGNKENHPLITVAIPTYKRATTLKDTLDSVLTQDDADDVEIIVVDNNPERGDETEQLMATYQDSRLRYYKNEANLGMTGNWNRFYTLAKGEWVCMLHDDDCLLPGYMPNVKMLLKELEGKADALFLTATKRMKDTPPAGELHLRKTGLITDLMAGCGIDIPGNLIRREVVMRLGGFNDTYYPSADYHFWLKLHFMARPFVARGCPLTYYRVAINESRKTETIMAFVRIGNIFQKAIMAEMNPLSRWFWKAYLPFLNAHHLSSYARQCENHTEEMRAIVREAKRDVPLPNKVFGFFMRHFLSLNRKRADFFASRVKVIG